MARRATTTIATKNEHIMKKTTLNLTIDLLMMVAMGIVSFSGFVLQYVARRKPTLEFEQTRQVVEAVFGLNRRGWHDAHLYTSYILLALLVLHVVLHWSSVSTFFHRVVPNTTLRAVLYILLFVIALLAIIPWIAAYM